MLGTQPCRCELLLSPASSGPCNVSNERLGIPEVSLLNLSPTSMEYGHRRRRVDQLPHSHSTYGPVISASPFSYNRLEDYPIIGNSRRSSYNHLESIIGGRHPAPGFRPFGPIIRARHGHPTPSKPFDPIIQASPFNPIRRSHRTTPLYNSIIGARHHYQPSYRPQSHYDPNTRTGKHPEPEMTSNVKKWRDPEQTLPPLRGNNYASLVLSGGQLTASYLGTSASAQGGGVPVCGLAAFNCARIVLRKSTEGITEDELLEDITREKTFQEIVSICQTWAGSAYPEVEEIADLPIFSNFLEPQGISMDRTATLSSFDEMLKRLEDIPQHPVVVMIAIKVSDIIACIRITIQERNVFVIFDPQSRPSHPDGSGLLIDADRERILEHLSELMGVDEELLDDSENESLSDPCFVPKLGGPDLESLFLKLSVQPHSKTHDADEQTKRVREECNKVAAKNSLVSFKTSTVTLKIRRIRAN
ncbi:hypothetical protein BDN72DRAFT_197003 [Pluteus cervinus]|uniref:Uncharacterized protein n=1 Tax=Pluteus cervinus TaxID=181527 RepID=A0ACD3AI20_9AGAR|nr:hypothetical protein BDN72DRAFT_197003 [Pluteus cervinus]